MLPDDRTNTMTVRTNRGGDGKFTRSIKSAQRDFAAADLRAKGRSLQGIAEELGFASRGHVHDAIRRAFAALPADGAEDAKRLDLERIDRLIEQAWTVMERVHVTVSQGRVVGKQTGWQRDESGEILRDGDGTPIPLYEDVLDDGPALASIREIRGLLDRRAKIFGYDAPARSRIEVITEDVFDAEMKQLEEEIAQREAAADPRTSREAAPAGRPAGS